MANVVSIAPRSITVSVIFARSAFEVPCLNTVAGIDYVICRDRLPHLSWLYRTISFERINERQENSSLAGLNRGARRCPSVVISSWLQSSCEGQLAQLLLSTQNLFYMRNLR